MNDITFKTLGMMTDIFQSLQKNLSRPALVNAMGGEVMMCREAKAKMFGVKSLAQEVGGDYLLLDRVYTDYIVIIKSMIEMFEK